MKTLILSDIHANIIALEAILAAEPDCDQIVCAGDLVDYGPFPNETLQCIRQHNVQCVAGNHDQYVLELLNGDLPYVPGTWLNHNTKALDDEHIDFLRQLPMADTFMHAQTRWGLVHAYQDYDTILSAGQFRAFTQATFGQGLERLVFGHTHRQARHYVSNDLMWLNPGSVSYRRPDDPDQSAHYAVLIDQEMYLRSCPYDVRPLFEAIDRCGITDQNKEVSLVFWGQR